jgi:hypothetical protein
VVRKEGRRARSVSLEAVGEDALVLGLQRGGELAREESGRVLGLGLAGVRTPLVLLAALARPGRLCYLGRRLRGGGRRGSGAPLEIFKASLELLA